MPAAGCPPTRCCGRICSSPPAWPPSASCTYRAKLGACWRWRRSRESAAQRSGSAAARAHARRSPMNPRVCALRHSANGRAQRDRNPALRRERIHKKTAMFDRMWPLMNLVLRCLRVRASAIVRLDTEPARHPSGVPRTTGCSRPGMPCRRSRDARTPLARARLCASSSTCGPRSCRRPWRPSTCG